MESDSSRTTRTCKYPVTRCLEISLLKDITPYLRSGVLFSFQGSIKRREEVTPDGRLSDLIIQFSLSKACLFFFLAGLRAVAHLWQEFVLEMRYRWENDIFIPRYSGKKLRLSQKSLLRVKFTTCFVLLYAGK